MIRLLPLLCTALLAACGGAQHERGGDGSYQVKGEAEPDDELAIQLAETFIEAGALQNAIPILRGALSRKPGDARLHYLLGTALRDRGIYSQAEAEFLIALKLNNKLAAAYSGLGILHDMTGRRESGVAHHLKATELAPHVARFHNNLGFSYYLAAQPKKAVAAYETALRMDPTAASVFVNYGFALAADNRDDDALRIFNKSLPPAAALNNLALARELRGDPDSAREAYLKALGMAPGLREANANLESMDQDIVRKARQKTAEETGP